MREFYVSLTGDDGNRGDRDCPFASIHQAVEAARGVGDDYKRVVVEGGKYYLDRVIELDGRDEGLVIECADGADVTLYGGVKINDWEKDGDTFYAATVTGVEDRSWDFRSLLVNGRFCRRARLPETGRYEHLSRFNVGWATTLERPCHAGFWREPTREEVTTLHFKDGDIGSWIDIKNAELTIFNSWETSLVGLENIDWKSNTIHFSNRSGMPPGAFGTHEFAIWNVREGMTRPGQWYLDRSNSRIVYWPRPGEDMLSAEGVAPSLESIIRVVGTEDEPVRNITIRGLSLSMTTTRLGGVKETYGEIVNYDGGDRTGRVDGLLFASHVSDCVFSDLEVAHAGGQGIKMFAVDDSRIENCHIHHTGSRGVTLFGNGTVMTNCHVHDVGLIYPAIEAVAVRGMFGAGITVSHCEIHDVSYTAIHVITAHDHVIENNLVYNAMKEMRDGSGIYLSFCHYVTVRGNFVRDVEMDPISKTTRQPGQYMHTQAHAYYLDEQSENCVIENNLALNCPSPYQGHQARNNEFRNNMFINDQEDILIHLALSWSENFNRNVWYSKGAVLVGNPKAITSFGNNLIYSGTGQVEGHDTHFYDPVAPAALNMDEGTVLDDPQFVGYRDGKVEFSQGSLAHTLGIRGIDVSSAGCTR